MSDHASTKTPMELDDLRGAWQALGRALERHNDLASRQFRDRTLERARSSLRPLQRGQVVQIAFGILAVVLGVSVWHRHLHDVALLAAGIVVHVYGIALIATGSVVLALIGRIDYTAPVVEIQTALARLHRTYLRTGLSLGMVWWVLWIPFTLAGFDAAFGVDLYAHMAGPIHWMIAASVIGLLATLALLRWSMRAGSPGLRKALLASATGRSLRRANAEVEALAAFAAE